jgi:hypothetical protein
MYLFIRILQTVLLALVCALAFKFGYFLVEQLP